MKLIVACLIISIKLLTQQTTANTTTFNLEEHLRRETFNIASSKLTTNTMMPRGSVIMIASSVINQWFNAYGQGLGEYNGWFLCDGRNGTPDLRGKFLVGRDEFTSGSAYSRVGMTGGTEFVQLAGGHLPSHSHQFHAQTSQSGSHTHRYMDVTYADGCDFPVPMYRGIRSGTAHNRACQIERYADASGIHDHSVGGATSSVGSNSPHENRPPFYVVAYIIFQG